MHLTLGLLAGLAQVTGIFLIINPTVELIRPQEH